MQGGSTLEVNASERFHYFCVCCTWAIRHKQDHEAERQADCFIISAEFLISS